MMKEKKYRPGVHAGYLLNRKICLLEINEENRRLILLEIDELLGIQEVSITGPKNVLRVAYDGTRVDINQIQQIVSSFNGSFAKGWWSGIKLDWYQYTDENVKANAKHVPHCCSKSPK